MKALSACKIGQPEAMYMMPANLQLFSITWKGNAVLVLIWQGMLTVQHALMLWYWGLHLMLCKIFCTPYAAFLFN